MAQSYCNLIYHIVFSTKDRQPWLRDDVRARTYEYLGGAVRKEGGVALVVNGTADHVHIILNTAVERGCRVQPLGSNTLAQKRRHTWKVYRGFCARVGGPMGCAIVVLLRREQLPFLGSWPGCGRIRPSRTCCATSKAIRPDGFIRRLHTCRNSDGRQGTARSPSARRISRRCGITSRNRKTITRNGRSKKSSSRCWMPTESSTINGTFGIERWSLERTGSAAPVGG